MRERESERARGREGEERGREREREREKERGRGRGTAILVECEDDRTGLSQMKSVSGLVHLRGRQMLISVLGLAGGRQGVVEGKSVEVGGRRIMNRRMMCWADVSA